MSIPVAVPPRLTARMPRWSYLAAPGAWPDAGAWGPACDGTVVVLPGQFSRDEATLLLSGVRQAIGTSGNLVLIHTGAGGASLLAALRQELPVRSLTIETAPTPTALTAAQALASRPLPGVHEVSVDAGGLATAPGWAACSPPRGECPLAPGDLVVITGGLGGLGCAIAQRLSERLGVHPVLLDQADPAGPEAGSSLAALRATGRLFTHVPVDVTDAATVRAVLRIVTASRPVRAVIHCAGSIAGGLVPRLDEAALSRLSAPKVDGLRAVLSAVDVRELRVVLAFGSILARAPHPGVGAYALANELLRREVSRWARKAPATRFLTAEWSIWDGAGVAAATGQVGNARRAGYEPIPLDKGLHLVERLLAWAGPQDSVLVSAAPPG